MTVFCIITCLNTFSTGILDAFDDSKGTDRHYHIEVATQTQQYKIHHKSGILRLDENQPKTAQNDEIKANFKLAEVCIKNTVWKFQNFSIAQIFP